MFRISQAVIVTSGPLQGEVGQVVKLSSRGGFAQINLPDHLDGLWFDTEDLLPID